MKIITKTTLFVMLFLGATVAFCSFLSKDDDLKLDTKKTTATTTTTKLAVATNSTGVSISTGFFNQNGQCDATTSYPCDMNLATAKNNPPQSSSAKILTLGSKHVELRFLKYNLTPGLRSKLESGVYNIPAPFEITDSSIKQNLGFSNTDLVLNEGTYQVSEQTSFFKITVPLVLSSNK